MNVFTINVKENRVDKYILDWLSKGSIKSVITIITSHTYNPKTKEEAKLQSIMYVRYISDSGHYLRSFC
jgi:hypothetical protein